MVDLGAYKDKFGDSGQRVLEKALGESRRRDQNYITVEHIIHALAQEEADLFNSTIRSLSVDPDAVTSALTGIAEGTAPPTDLNGDPEYRRHLVSILGRRAVLAAARP